MAAETILHFYQCAACQTTAITTAPAVHGKLWRCVGCYSPMRRLYSTPARSQRELQWARYGVVYNPGISTCDVCGIKLTPETRLEIPCVGQFCGTACAEPEVTRHQEAMEPRHV